MFYNRGCIDIPIRFRHNYRFFDDGLRVSFSRSISGKNVIIDLYIPVTFFRAIGAPTTGIFVLGIFTTKTHPTGILVGTITSQTPLVLKIIGGKYFPTPPEILNLTGRNATLCGNLTSTLLQIKSTIPVEIDSVFVSDEPAYPWWHKIFWISNIGWNGIFCLLMFCIPG